MNKRFLLHNSISASCIFRDNEQLTNVQPIYEIVTECTCKEHISPISQSFSFTTFDAFHSNRSIETPESTQIYYSQAYISPSLFEYKAFPIFEHFHCDYTAIFMKWKFSSVDRRGSTCIDHNDFSRECVNVRLMKIRRRRTNIKRK